MSDFATRVNKIYLNSTTKYSNIENNQDWWVSSGDLLILIENYSNRILNKYQIKSFNINQENVTLSHFLFKNKAKKYNLWEVYSNKESLSTNVSGVSTVSKSIIDIHIEYESIKSIIRNIIKQRMNLVPKTSSSEFFQYYINETISKLSQGNKVNNSTSEIFNVTTISHHEIFSKHEIEKALLELSKIRRNIVRKIAAFMNHKGNHLSSINDLDLSLTEKDLFTNETNLSLRTKIFISYSHKDKDWLEQVVKHFKPVSRSGLIELWSDQKILAGQHWKAEINNALKTARVAILIITADFLDSDFIIQNELPPLLKSAEEKGTIIIPLIAKPSLFNIIPSLSQFQAINDPNQPLSGLSEDGRDKILVNLVLETIKILT